MFTASLPIYLKYVFFGPSFALPDPRRVYSANTTASLRFSLPVAPPHLRSPLLRLHNSSHNASLEVVSLGVKNKLLEVVLQTSLNAEGRVLSLTNSFASAESGISLAMELLQTSSPQKPVVQLWKVTARGILSDYSGTYHIELVNCVVHPQYRSYCVPRGKVNFGFQIERKSNGNGYLVGVVSDITLKTTSNDKVFNQGKFSCIMCAYTCMNMRMPGASVCSLCSLFTPEYIRTHACKGVRLCVSAGSHFPVLIPCKYTSMGLWCAMHLARHDMAGGLPLCIIPVCSCDRWTCALLVSLCRRSCRSECWHASWSGPPPRTACGCNKSKYLSRPEPTFSCM